MLFFFFKIAIVASVTFPNFFHRTSEIFSILTELTRSCPELVYVPTSSIHAFYMKSDSAKSTFLIFGEHPRELISPELGLRIIQKICNGELKILEYTSLTIVVNASPIGRTRVENGEFCLRSNENNVDINRNWGAFWEKNECKSEINTCSGPYAFSEEQTVEIRDLLDSSNADLFISVHSGINAMFIPYAHDFFPIPEKDEEKMLKVLTTIDKEFDLNMEIGPASEILSYLSPGNCMDYAYSVSKVPYTYAWEIYSDRPHLESISFLQGQTPADSSECLSKFNPLEKKAYEKLLYKWTSAFEKTISLVHT